MKKLTDFFALTIAVLYIALGFYALIALTIYNFAPGWLGELMDVLNERVARSPGVIAKVMMAVIVSGPKLLIDYSIEILTLGSLLFTLTPEKFLEIIRAIIPAVNSPWVKKILTSCAVLLIYVGVAQPFDEIQDEIDEIDGISENVKRLEEQIKGIKIPPCPTCPSTGIDFKRAYLDEIFDCKNAEEIFVDKKKVYFPTGSCLLTAAGKGAKTCASNPARTAWVAEPGRCEQDSGQLVDANYIGKLKRAVGNHLNNGKNHVLIIGAASNVGRHSYNFELGTQRAKAVKQTLIVESGVESADIRAESIGELFVASDTDTSKHVVYKDRCGDRRVDIYACD